MNQRGLILQNGRGMSAVNPIADPMELMKFVRERCGADGYRIEGNMLVALRWDLDGNEVVADRFELCVVNS